MGYHGTVYNNKQIRKLLGDDIHRFQLLNIDGRPAKTKNKVKKKDKYITVFGSDFIAKGYFKDDPPTPKAKRQ